MPIVQTFKGTIQVEGKSDNNTHPDYLNSKTAYGETIGELLDNLVAASVTLTNELFEWSVTNLPSDYNVESNSWYASMTYPDILSSRKSDVKTHQNDIGTVHKLSMLESLVIHAITTRSIDIEGSLRQLRVMSTNYTHRDEETPAVLLEDSSHVQSYGELIKYGFTGVELDAALAAADEKGWLDGYSQYLNRRQESYNLRQELEKQKVTQQKSVTVSHPDSVKRIPTETPTKKKKWWN